MKEWLVQTPIFGGIIALFGLIIKHLSNTDKHPNKKNIVYRDKCNERTQRIEEKIEATEKNLCTKIDNLDKQIEDHHKELKNLIFDDD